MIQSCLILSYGTFSTHQLVQKDMEKTIKGTEDVYETFNILLRRKPKENNFKVCI